MHLIVYKDLGAQEMKHKLNSAVDSLSYSALLVFIMTHGTNEDMLYGSDEKHVLLEKLVECFEADHCPHLKDKPEIFILHYCRGENEEYARRRVHSRGHSHAVVLPENPQNMVYNHDLVFLSNFFHIMF